ncbi:hypothetical protein [Effusibacillus dendaii]|uniref:Uncharacterized protein n=1 Tax=Effusibacillus dendaii TaxID=2743772 RepID=A0A7I8DBP3_9BACL|nr:hypothetical protein [Effusibacillus dendaii]BCJ87397.1 hypothetical protein skT53_23820 [Effusibacillus dendaii]
MTLHPIFTAIVLILFGLMAVPPMLSLARERRFGLAGLMLLTFVAFVVAGIAASTVPPGAA